MEIPRHWRLKKQRYCLIGSIDSNDKVDFPPTQVGKFGNEDQERSLAIHNAAKVAEKNLVLYTDKMLKAQNEQFVEV